jgi:perosamine synthetase
MNFFNTFIDPSAISKVTEVLNSTYLSEGKLVKEFEDKLAQMLGIVNPIAVNSGTTALHLALVLAGVEEGDEVILPAQTFVATGLVILQQKAIPIFADVNYQDGNISVEDIRRKITKKTKAIIAVHWAGYPCDMDEICKIANEHKLKVIEDAAHALGAEYKGRSIGSISDFTCFSFQAIKHLTTGDGGLLSCKSVENYQDAIKMRWFGIDRVNSAPSILGERIYNLDKLGFKYHLNDYEAALGLANLFGFKQRLQHLQDISEIYENGLRNTSEITLFERKNDRKSSNWLFGFHINDRIAFIEYLKNLGIPSSVVHQRIDKYKVFGSETKGLTNQERFDTSQIHIPIHNAITVKEANFIVDSIKKYFS